MIPKIRTRRIRTSHLRGSADGRSAASPSCGRGNLTAGAIWISKPTCARELALTGRFPTPMEMSCAEIAVKEAMDRQFGRERVLTIGRAAILTQTHNGRGACHYCGP